METQKKLIRKNEPSDSSLFGNANKQELARKMINQSQIPAKTWAMKIGVSERFIQMICSGTRIIPGTKLDMILEYSHELLCEQRDCTNKLLDDLMKFKFNDHDRGY